MSAALGQAVMHCYRCKNRTNETYMKINNLRLLPKHPWLNRRGMASLKRDRRTFRLASNSISHSQNYTCQLLHFFVVVLLTLTACAANAQTKQNIDGSALLFCLDSTGVYQPFQRTNYKRLQDSFVRQFGWGHSLVSTSNSLGLLEFAPERQIKSNERIVYDVEPYNGGIALLHMHVRLQGINEDLSGNEMCFRTFGLVNIK